MSKGEKVLTILTVIAITVAILAWIYPSPFSTAPEVPEFNDQVYIPGAITVLNGNTYQMFTYQGLTGLVNVTDGFELVVPFEYANISYPFQTGRNNFLWARTDSVRRLIDMDNGYVIILEFPIDYEIGRLGRLSSGIFMIIVNDRLLWFDSDGIEIVRESLEPNPE